ncbi:hypothetical protein EVAR_100191_1 [Eumeta japonica]|uniref:Uncharacterized protein n=1 Tax=Eumeta variegata TaxID=151549 RepID=A0A4C2A8R1_EUMVA|nr:hypothetical protein EVAR_100191_1 [Eumeta japonica]
MAWLREVSALRLWPAERDDTLPVLRFCEMQLRRLPLNLSGVDKHTHAGMLTHARAHTHPREQTRILKNLRIEFRRRYDSCLIFSEEGSGRMRKGRGVRDPFIPSYHSPVIQGGRVSRVVLYSPLKRTQPAWKEASVGPTHIPAARVAASGDRSVSAYVFVKVRERPVDANPAR